MDSAQLQELADLLASVSSVNNGKSRTHVGECIIYNGEGEPVAKAVYNNDCQFVLTQLIPHDA